MHIQTRTTAAAEGKTTYNTGKLCKRSHVTSDGMPYDRYVSTGNCVKCTAENTKRINKIVRDSARTGMVMITAQVPARDAAHAREYLEMLVDAYQAERSADITKIFGVK